MNKEITTGEKPTEMAVTQISPIVQLAMDKDLDPQKLEKLLEVQIQYEKREAEKAYHTAIAEFKKVAPVIDKNVEVSYSTSKGLTRYNHSSLGYITATVVPLLSQYGLSLTWTTNQTENGVIGVTAVLTHAMGHSQQTTLTAPADQSGGKNAIQAMKSTVTYLERITGMALLGLAESDSDTDGVPDDKISDADELPISPEKVLDLKSLLDEKGKSEDQLIRFINAKKKLNLESIGGIPESLYDGIVKFVEGQK